MKLTDFHQYYQIEKSFSLLARLLDLLGLDLLSYQPIPIYRRRRSKHEYQI